MSDEAAATSSGGIDATKILTELEVPFPPDQIRWRVMNTSNDKKRGQVVAYADPRAYTDRLNSLVSPLGWTRDYHVETMTNIPRVKSGETIVSGKVFVTCTVTLTGLGSHSGTGEEWADDSNGMTSADAQAFKRACCCFGLGRYFYDCDTPWVDLDQNRQPLMTPTLPAWAIPENWRQGMRPPPKNGNGNGAGKASSSLARSSDASRANGASKGNGHAAESASNGNRNRSNGSGANERADLDARILRMQAVVGTSLYRHILREHGRVNQPKLIRDAAVKQKVLRVLESAARGVDRLQAVTQRLDPDTVSALLAKLQAPPLTQIADIKTLEQVVLGLEDLASPNHHHAA